MSFFTAINSCKKDKDEEPEPTITNPNADFTYSIDKANAPLTVIFNNTSTNANSYEWDFGDGKSSTDKNPTNTYSNEGKYTIKLTAKGNSSDNYLSKEIELVIPNLIGAEFIELGEAVIRQLSYSSDTNVYDHVAFPDFAKLSDGRLLCTWREATEHMQDPKAGKFMKSIGSADGLTWSEATLLYDEPGKDDRDISLNRMSDGTIIADFFKSYSGYCYILKSKDDGQTWIGYDSVKANGDGGWSVPSAQAVEINGEIWIPTYGNDGTYSKSRVVMVKSKNNGTSWSTEVINGEDLKSFNLQEPTIIKAHNNRLIMHVRTYGAIGMGKMAQCYSDDGGKTWTSWKFFGFIGHAPELYKTESGVLISAFRYLNSDATETYTGMMYSVDNGETWSDRIVVDVSDAETGYPSIESLGNDKFIISYYRLMYSGNSYYMQIKAKTFQCNAEYMSKK
ncbi:MAG: hypothetical protein A2X12_08430 [Bacteroidetes bacterium GWE2_29_8]|nr:MAG: hypothetical protein A2X12_08430 [Bacteroidetes bacterium GWE2_29_8]OFY15895.1 MAG: hypothetical protein A2X02_04845 [Bacteroidetes bacterium GWF2_29_10]